MKNLLRERPGTAILFFLAILFCMTPLASPPMALALGLVLALTVGNPAPGTVQRVTRRLLQASVVGLGFGMNLTQVAEAGRRGLLFTIVSIAGTLLAGILIGRSLAVASTTTSLVTAGTAICGGSAIAALAPVLEARQEEISVSLATIFILNSIALFLFPPLGTFFNLTQSQFGVWSGVAIHDTSSVVGAAARYGAEALQIATTVKLTRALWIVPIVLVIGLMHKKQGTRVVFPWFIVLFLAASMLRTWMGPVEALAPTLVRAARVGLTVTLFLIGAGLTRASIRAVGARPLILGVILWLLVSSVSLVAVRNLVQ